MTIPKKAGAGEALLAEEAGDGLDDARGDGELDAGGGTTEGRTDEDDETSREDDARGDGLMLKADGLGDGESEEAGELRGEEEENWTGAAGDGEGLDDTPALGEGPAEGDGLDEEIGLVEGPADGDADKLAGTPWLGEEPAGGLMLDEAGGAGEGETDGLDKTPEDAEGAAETDDTPGERLEEGETATGDGDELTEGAVGGPALLDGEALGLAASDDEGLAVAGKAEADGPAEGLGDGDEDAVAGLGLADAEGEAGGLVAGLMLDGPGDREEDAVGAEIDDDLADGEGDADGAGPALDDEDAPARVRTPPIARAPTGPSPSTAHPLYEPEGPGEDEEHGDWQRRKTVAPTKPPLRLKPWYSGF